MFWAFCDLHSHGETVYSTPSNRRGSHTKLLLKKMIVPRALSLTKNQWKVGWKENGWWEQLDGDNCSFKRTVKLSSFKSFGTFGLDLNLCAVGQKWAKKNQPKCNKKTNIYVSILLHLGSSA